MSRRHEVVLHRIGRWWAIDVPGLDLHSQCRTLEEAEGLARGLIAEAVGVAPEAIVVDMVVTDFAALLGSVREARQRRAAAVAAEQRAIGEAVRELVENLRVSRGDAARLLGLSPEEMAHFMPPRGSGGNAGQLSPVPAHRPPRPRDTFPPPTGSRPAQPAPQTGSAHRRAVPMPRT